MNTIATLLSKAASNPHTSYAAILFLVLKVGSQLAQVWWPTKSAQVKTTFDILEGAAVAYLGLAAGDSGKSISKEEADTTFVKKQETKS